jgi:hypothetical protein
MRIQIDGSWSSDNFAEFFAAISATYNLQEFRGGEGIFTADGQEITLSDGSKLSIAAETSVTYSVRVTEISFASPGFTDFAGAGAVLSEIRLMIQYFCELRGRRNEQDLINEERKIRVQAMRQLLENTDQARLSKAAQEVLKLSVIEPLLDAVAQQRIVGAAETGADIE